MAWTNDTEPSLVAWGQDSEGGAGFLLQADGVSYILQAGNFQIILSGQQASYTNDAEGSASYTNDTKP